MKGYNVAVVGATGAVGLEMIKVLEQRNFPVSNLRLFASERSEGRELEFKGEKIKVEALKEDVFKKYSIQIALFSAGASVSKEIAPIAAKSGTIVVDNSSAFRMEPDVPLVVPEVNPEDVKWNKGIISNPNCSTIQMVVALKPIYDYAKIKRIIVATYQAVSGAGAKAIWELEEETKKWCKGEPIDTSMFVKFPYQIAFNVIPQIDIFVDGINTREELKMVNETKKIMHDNNIKVSATCVRVPVFRGHSEAVVIETEKKVGREKAIELLSKAPGVKVVDDPANKLYPMPIDADGKDEVFVGRIRETEVFENGLAMWIVSDNLRKGAALNAVQIAELLIKYNLV